MGLPYHGSETQRHVVVIEQGGKLEVALDAVNETIDSMTKTAVFFSLQTESLWRNC